MNDVQKLFGSLVFNETVMKDRLPTATYKAYKQAIIEGKPLNIEIANIIANAMKDYNQIFYCSILPPNLASHSSDRKSVV